MFTMICPACGAHMVVRRASAGRAVDCPGCAGRVAVTVPPGSLPQVLWASHPAGLWLGRSLLAVAVVAAGLAAWAVLWGGKDLHAAIRRPAASGSGLQWLYVAAACAALGGLLIARWRQARRRIARA